MQVPKRYRSCKWNGMRVTIIEDEGKDALTINRKGRKLRFYKKWLIPANLIIKEGEIIGKEDGLNSSFESH